MSTEKLVAAHVAAGANVLGAWFDHEKFRAAWRPDPSLFATTQQQACAEIMAQRGTDLTIDGLVLALRRADKLKLFDFGAEGVHELVSRPWQADPWAALAKLRDAVGLLELRKRLDEAIKIIDSSAELDTARKVVSDALKASDVASGAKARTFREVLQSARDQATREKKQHGARTLSARIDRATGGIRPHNVWVVAASTSWGKTSLLCGIASRYTRHTGRPPLIVSFEDPEVLYGQRILQFRRHINALRLRDGELTREELRQIDDEIEHAPKKPFFISAIGRSIRSVAADIRSLCASEGITLVFGDYVQAMQSHEPQQDRRNEVNYCARQFIDAVKQSDAGGVLFSQLTEDKSTGQRKARESEDLHNFAECLFFGFKEREPALNHHGQKTGEYIERRYLWADKVKDGPAHFKVEMTWSDSAACFIPDDEDENDPQLPLGDPPDDYFDDEERRHP